MEFVHIGRLLNIYPPRPHGQTGFVMKEHLGRFGTASGQGLHIISLWSGMQRHDRGFLTSN
jgi:hypothetical protein